MLWRYSLAYHSFTTLRQTQNSVVSQGREDSELKENQQWQKKKWNENGKLNKRKSVTTSILYSGLAYPILYVSMTFRFFSCIVSLLCYCYIILSLNDLCYKKPPYARRFTFILHWLITVLNLPKHITDLYAHVHWKRQR